MRRQALRRLRMDIGGAVKVALCPCIFLILRRQRARSSRGGPTALSVLAPVPN
jgi:hypothetical protein